MRHPERWAEYEYFRRRTGLKAKDALTMARAEAWMLNSHLEFGIDLGVAYLCEKRLRDVPLKEGPWDERDWEFSEPLVVMPRPEGISDRIVAATLAARLLAGSKKY